MTGKLFMVFVTAGSGAAGRKRYWVLGERNVRNWGMEHLKIRTRKGKTKICEITANKN